MCPNRPDSNIIVPQNSTPLEDNSINVGSIHQANVDNITGTQVRLVTMLPSDAGDVGCESEAEAAGSGPWDNCLPDMEMVLTRFGISLDYLTPVPLSQYHWWHFTEEIHNNTDLPISQRIKSLVRNARMKS